MAALALFVAAASASAQTRVALERVAEARAPIDLADIGEGRLLVAQLGGEIRVLDRASGAFAPDPFLDLSREVSQGEQQGLFALALHPDFAQNGLLYVSYTDLEGASIVERYRASPDRSRAPAQSRRRLLRIDQPFPNNNGGGLQIGPRDGLLYFATGDGGGQNDPLCRAQRREEILGKLLRLDVRQNLDRAPFYGIPADNPFTAATDPEGRVPDELWALGLRNPFRFSFDRDTGDLYLADESAAAISGEINFQPARAPGGANFGWKLMDGRSCFSTEACPLSVPVCGGPELTAPLFEVEKFGGDCAVIGGFVYRGARAPELFGRYVYGDFCTGVIRVLEPGAAGEPRSRVVAEAGPELRSFAQDTAGGLYALVGDAIFELVSRP